MWVCIFLFSLHISLFLYILNSFVCSRISLYFILRRLNFSFLTWFLNTWILFSPKAWRLLIKCLSFIICWWYEKRSISAFWCVFLPHNSSETNIIMSTHYLIIFFFQWWTQMRPNAIALVDSFDHTDHYLGSVWVAMMVMYIHIFTWKPWRILSTILLWPRDTKGT